jgi:hypothetical protein
MNATQLALRDHILAAVSKIDHRLTQCLTTEADLVRFVGVGNMVGMNIPQTLRISTLENKILRLTKLIMLSIASPTCSPVILRAYYAKFLESIQLKLEYINEAYGNSDDYRMLITTSRADHTEKQYNDGMYLEQCNQCKKELAGIVSLIQVVIPGFV